MKNKNYIKVSLINKKQSDVIENQLPLIALIIEMIISIILQGEFNAVSIILLIGVAISLIQLSYQIGKKAARKGD